MNNDDLHKLRTEYATESLSKHLLNSNPVEQFRDWLKQAIDAEVLEPNTFVLSTVNKQGQPDSRVVLIKEIRPQGIVFYTNYESQKGQQIAANQLVSACFLWKSLFRQVRMQGKCQKLTAQESDAYFYKRPLESQLAAIISPQSKEIENRQWLEQRMKEQQNAAIKRPSHWGGYLITLHQVEFWQGQPNRLHDRFVYRKQEDDSWKLMQLAP